MTNNAENYVYKYWHQFGSIESMDAASACSPEDHGVQDSQTLFSGLAHFAQTLGET